MTVKDDKIYFSCKYKELDDTDLTYSIGDIHGMIDQLDELVEMIYADIKANPDKTYKIVFHGDYVDRGESSKAVLDKLRELEKTDSNTNFIMGNHDQMLLQYCEEYAYRGYRNQYKETFDSFYETHKEIPDDYIKWISKLDVAMEDSKRIYVHAGINPFNSIQVTSDLIWIREPFLSYPFDFMGGKIVVHGHTPDETGPVIVNNRVNLDTGVFYSGILSCVVFDDFNNETRTIQAKGKPVPRFAEF